MARKLTVQDMEVLTLDRRTWIWLRIFAEEGVWETFDRASAACLFFKLTCKHIDKALPLLAQWDPEEYARLKELMDRIAKRKHKRKE